MPKSLITISERLLLWIGRVFAALNLTRSGLHSNLNLCLLAVSYSSFKSCIDLYNYEDHFEKILFKVCKIFIKEMVFVLEFRHIFGMVIDDDGKAIGT
jgi:hypothetical protein